MTLIWHLPWNKPYMLKALAKAHLAQIAVQCIGFAVHWSCSALQYSALQYSALDSTVHWSCSALAATSRPASSHSDAADFQEACSRPKQEEQQLVKPPFCILSHICSRPLACTFSFDKVHLVQHSWTLGAKCPFPANCVGHLVEPITHCITTPPP